LLYVNNLFIYELNCINFVKNQEKNQKLYPNNNFKNILLDVNISSSVVDDENESE